MLNTHHEYLCILVECKISNGAAWVQINIKPQNCKTTILWNIKMTQNTWFTQKNIFLITVIFILLDIMGTPKVLSMVILGVGSGDWLVNPLSIGFLMASSNAYSGPSRMSLIQKRCRRSITAVQVWVPLSSPHRRVQNDRVLLTADPEELDNKIWLHDQGYRGSTFSSAIG